VRVLLHSKSLIVDDIPGFVRELQDQADADLSAEEAGRLCYLSGHRPNPKTATNADYLLNICNERHYSVLGHSFFSFYIDEVSRNETHEKIRHRWFTYSEVSQRYVDAENFWMVGHPGLRDLDEEHKDKIQSDFIAAKESYREIVDALTAKGYKRKEARQAARSVLPSGTETKILMSGNLRAWRDFLAQRLAPGADLEIRSVALEIYKILKQESPNSFQDFDSRGMITVERLIQRALDRHDFGLSTSKEYVWVTREILKNGLWTLKDDPWKDEEK